MGNSKSNKKLFSFDQLELINLFLKDNAAVSGSNESKLVEDIILNYYLSENRDISYSVRSYLFSGDKGITDTGKSIFSQLAALPEYVDNTAYPLIDFYRLLERENPTDLNNSNGNLTHFMRCLQSLRDVFGFYTEKEELAAETVGGERFNIYDLRLEVSIIDELLDTFKSGETGFPAGNISIIMDLICKCWLLPLPDGRPLRNFSFLYRFLCDLMQLASYPSTPKSRFQLARIARNLCFYDSSKIL